VAEGSRRLKLGVEPRDGDLELLGVGAGVPRDGADTLLGAPPNVTVTLTFLGAGAALFEHTVPGPTP